MQPILITQLSALNVTRNSIYTTFSKLISLSSLTHFLSFSKSFIHSMYSHKLLLTLFGILLLPILVYGDSDTETEGRDSDQALIYKLAAIGSILVTGAIGVCIPVLGKEEKDIFFIIKAFAAGVILATGFIHILQDAFENLKLPWLSENPWGNFPFTGFVAMVSAIGTLMVESFATSYNYERSRLNNTRNQHGMDYIYWRCREVWNSWSCSWILFFNWLTIRLHRTLFGFNLWNSYFLF